MHPQELACHCEPEAKQSKSDARLEIEFAGVNQALSA
jgi:hypothetical protein